MTTELQEDFINPDAIGDNSGSACDFLSEIISRMDCVIEELKVRNRFRADLHFYFAHYGLSDLIQSFEYGIRDHKKIFGTCLPHKIKGSLEKLLRRFRGICVSMFAVRDLSDYEASLWAEAYIESLKSVQRVLISLAKCNTSDKTPIKLSV